MKDRYTEYPCMPSFKTSNYSLFQSQVTVIAIINEMQKKTVFMSSNCM